MIQKQIDMRHLQDIRNDPIMVIILMLRHFIPLYYTRSDDAHRVVIARTILFYCDAVPIIAREYYREVCKLLRA
jgi:hypothetical protein